LQTPIAHIFEANRDERCENYVHTAPVDDTGISGGVAPMVDELKRLIAVNEISELKARYFRLLDTKCWREFGDLFTSDANVDGREGFAAKDPATSSWTVNGRSDLVTRHLTNLDLDGMRVSGSHQIAAKAESLFPPQIITVHHGHMAEIAIGGSDSANAVWAMEDLILYPDGHPIRELRGYGHYHETYTRQHGAWKISGFRLTRLRVDIR
jgi:hypothetical protein